MDARISQYREAALRMKDGHFRPNIPTWPEDDLAQLGRALVELGRTLEGRFEEVRRLAEVTEKINAGFFVEEVLNHVYESFRPIIPYNRIGFSLLEDEGRIIRAYWARSDATEIFLGKDYHEPLKENSLGAVIASERPRIINDLEAYLLAHPTSESTRRVVAEGMRSSLACPLIAMGRPMGVMFFSSTQTNTYSNVHVELFRHIAGQLATIVEKSRLYQQLVEINDEKNRLLGVVAHDLRNPISVVKGLAGFLSRGMWGELLPPQRDAIRRMDHACETMLTLLEDLLDISAIESGQLQLRPTPVSVAELLEEAYEANALQATEKKMVLRLEVPAELPPVCLDGGRLHQVLNNLLSNAVKFSWPGSTIWLTAALEEPYLAISVRDQGQGIAEEEIPSLFKEFGRSSVRPTGGEKSTGLGLAIVKRIVEAHGGRMRVYSRRGEGSSFTALLPLDAEKVRQSARHANHPSRGLEHYRLR